MVPFPESEQGASMAGALALVPPTEKVVGEQIDQVQTAVPCQEGDGEVDLHRMV
jgi:hypothetical protein